MRTRAAASSALAGTRAGLRPYLSCTRAGMSRGNVYSFIVTYFISTVITMGVQSLRHSSNPLLRTLTPIRMYQSQLVWNYYCLYITCPRCCKYLYIPRTAPDSNIFELVPTWSLPAILSHEERLQNTGPLDIYSVLDENILSELVQSVDHYKLLSLIKSFQNGRLPLRVDNISQAKTTVYSTKKISDSIEKNIVTTKTITSSTSKVGVTLNNNYKGRRTDEVNSTAGVKSDMQPSVFLLNTTGHLRGTTDHMLSTWNVSLINSPLEVVRKSSTNDLTKASVPKVNNHEKVQIKSSTNDLTKSSIHGKTYETVELKNSTNDLTKATIPHVNNYETVQLKVSTKDSSYTRGLTDKTYQSNNQTKRHILFRKFRIQLDQVERKFLLTVFKKLSAISPEDRKVNGISFLQSGFFLYQLLLSLSITLDRNVTQEIEDFLGLNMTEADKVEILERTVKWLPKSSDLLKFRWSSRLVLQSASDEDGGIRNAAARAPLQLSWLHGNETAANLTQTLNDVILSDSEGSMHDTFEEEELSGGVCAAVLGTACVRGAWRAAPTLLNDSLPFRDAPAAPNRTSRFFRLNDIMGYTHLHEWDAEAIEISYATPGLTLLILVPKEPSLRALVERVAGAGLDHVVGFMRPMRLAVTLPLYTLRMTLLLPNKLADMGMPSLLTNGTNCHPVKLSHAVQRLMFWAEAGRNAFKDDGIEWDPRPELEIVVDRPYLFFVRWQNITIMNGVFAL